MMSTEHKGGQRVRQSTGWLFLFTIRVVGANQHYLLPFLDARALLFSMMVHHHLFIILVLIRLCHFRVTFLPD